MNTSHALEHFSENVWLHYIESVESAETLRVVYLVSILVIFIAGVGGNVVTCVVIYCDRSMHTVTNFYLFNLAVSDLVVLLTIPVEVCYYSGQFPFFMQHSLNEAVCKVHFFMVGALWNNGILIMTALAVERYAAIARPLQAERRARRRVARVMAGAGGAAALAALPDALTVRLVDVRRAPLCFISLSTFSRWVNAAAALGTFLLPLAVMLYVYTAIAVTINASQDDNYEHNIFNRRNNKNKVNKLIIALTLSFLACWLPYFGLRVLVALGEPRTLLTMAQNWQLVYTVIAVSSWFSSVLNPLLFSLMSTKFRKALKNLWHAKLLRRNVKRVPVLI